jgi:hypothetical protein
MHGQVRTGSKDQSAGHLLEHQSSPRSGQRLPDGLHHGQEFASFGTDEPAQISQAQGLL